VFERTIGVTVNGDESMMDDENGCENKENVLMENINEENERLRRDNEILRRELACMSPTKRVPLQERGSDAALGKARVDPGSPKPSRGKANAGADEGNIRRRLENLRVSDDSVPRNSSGSTSPKKVRKLTTKRWDANGNDDDLF